MRPEDEADGPDIDDWLADDDPSDAPTRESPGGKRRPPRPPGPGVQGRRVIALVAIASVILLVIIVATRGGDEEPAADEPPPTTAQTETGGLPESDVPPPLVLEANGALGEGDNGRPVRRLQRALALLGYDVEPDGQYGPGTTDAVRQFQADADLEVDGVAGPGTIAAINQALAGVG